MEKAFIINLLLLFGVKVIDNILGTSKTILIQQNHGVIAALLATISQIIFYKLISEVNNAGDIALYLVSAASGIGTFLAIRLANRFSKEKTFVNVIMSDDKEAMEQFRDYLKAKKITNLATPAYQKDWNETIAITAYAETKDESRMIDQYIQDSSVKFKRLINAG